MAAKGPLPSMPVLEHLRELRMRLIYSVLGLLVGLVLGLPLARPAIARLTAMCPACHIQALDPTEAIVTYFRAALVMGLAVALPVILYQVVMFVQPGLYPAERRRLYLLLPGAAVLFVVGLLFGFFVVLPRTIGFLAAFSESWAEPNWRIGTYVAFVTNMLLVVGLAFETPLVVVVLSRTGVVSTELLVRYRRHAIVILAIAAAVLTPTPDPFTMFLVLIPMILLYELGIFLTRIA